MNFILSKLLWVLLAPANLLVLLLLTGVFLAMAERQGLQDFGKKLSFSVAFLLFFIAIFPVGDWLLLPLENRFPAAKPERVDGIIVIGGDEDVRVTETRGKPTAYQSLARYNEFARLSRLYPNAKLVFSGGMGLVVPGVRTKTADVARAAFEILKVPVENVTFEEKSRNTHENATLSKELAKPSPEQTWLLVTSAWHMPRAIAVFRKAGWNIVPAPTDYITDGRFSTSLNFQLARHIFEVTIAVREYVGLVAYKLLGYTDEVWPK